MADTFWPLGSGDIFNDNCSMSSIGYSISIKWIRLWSSWQASKRNSHNLSNRWKSRQIREEWRAEVFNKLILSVYNDLHYWQALCIYPVSERSSLAWHMVTLCCWYIEIYFIQNIRGWVLFLYHVRDRGTWRQSRHRYVVMNASNHPSSTCVCETYICYFKKSWYTSNPFTAVIFNTSDLYK